MAVNLYKRGALVRVTAAYKNAAGNAVDPSAVRMKFRAPGSSSATVWTFGGTGSIVKDGAGNYHADIDTSSASGVWYYRWESDAPNQAANEGQFNVDATLLT